MSWNYRLIEDSQGGYNIHEVYYNVKGEPYMWSLNPCLVYGETHAEVYSVLSMMRKALDKPPLRIKGDCIVASNY